MERLSHARWLPWFALACWTAAIIIAGLVLLPNHWWPWSWILG